MNSTNMKNINLNQKDVRILLLLDFHNFRQIPLKFYSLFRAYTEFVTFKINSHALYFVMFRQISYIEF